jgi:hypothetical protein
VSRRSIERRVPSLWRTGVHPPITAKSVCSSETRRRPAPLAGLLLNRPLRFYGPLALHHSAHVAHAAHAAAHAGSVLFGCSSTIASVMRMFFAIDAAFCNAERVTMAGSMIPAFTRSSTSFVSFVEENYGRRDGGTARRPATRRRWPPTLSSSSRIDDERGRDREA